MGLSSTLIYTSELILYSTFYLPSRLLWTKAAYDYMYASGETLLRNFPVQATIQVIDNYDDSDDDDDDEEIEEECVEQQSTKKCKQ